jgi:hypothetical protein
MNKSNVSDLWHPERVVPERSCNLSGKRFPKEADFSGMLFKGFADFTDAVFEGAVDFSNSRFMKGCTFKDATFLNDGEDVLFEHTHFLTKDNGVSFESTRFGRVYRLRVGAFEIAILKKGNNYSLTLKRMAGTALSAGDEQMGDFRVTGKSGDIREMEFREGLAEVLMSWGLKTLFDEVLKEFSSYAVEKGNPGRVSFANCRFGEDGSADLRGDIDFSKTDFQNFGEVSFSHATFNNGGNLLFKDTGIYCGGNLDFTGAVFMNGGEVRFSQTRFNNCADVLFSSAHFANEHYLVFDKASFTNHGKVLFDFAGFMTKGGVSFFYTLFANKNNLSFEWARFQEWVEVRFEETLFLCGGTVDFKGTRFPEKGSLTFQNSYFGNGVGEVEKGSRASRILDLEGAFFRNATLNGGQISWLFELSHGGNEVFLSEILKSRKLPPPSTDAMIPVETQVFGKDLEVNWRGITSGSASNITLRMVDISRSRFDGLTLQNIQLNSVHFLEGFNRRILYGEVLAEMVYQKAKKSANGPNETASVKKRYLLKVRELEDQYGQLRNNFERMGDYRSGGEFHYSEQEMRRKRYSFFNRWFSLTNLYRIFAGYGEKPLRAGFWLVAFLLLFPFVFLGIQQFLPRFAAVCVEAVPFFLSPFHAPLQLFLSSFVLMTAFRFYQNNTRRLDALRDSFGIVSGVAVMVFLFAVSVIVILEGEGGSQIIKHDFFSSLSESYLQSVLKLVTPFSWSGDIDFIDSANWLRYLALIFGQIFFFFQSFLFMVSLRRRFKR